MATALTVAKARAVGLGIEKMIGVTPSYRYYPDYALIYFEPDRLQAVQAKLAEWEKTSTGPSDIRIDWMPAVTPMVIRKTLPIAAGIFLLGYLLGR